MKKNLIFTGGIFHPFDETSKTLSNIIDNYGYESEITHNRLSSDSFMIVAQILSSK